MQQEGTITEEKIEELLDKEKPNQKEFIKILNRAIDDLIENKEEYEKLNPENGWGSYKGLLKSLKNLRIACLENPNGKVEIV